MIFSSPKSDFYSEFILNRYVTAYLQHLRFHCENSFGVLILNGWTFFMDPVSFENLVHQPNKFYTVTEYTDTRHYGLTDIS